MGKEGGKEGAEKGEEVGLNLYKESLHAEPGRRKDRGVKMGQFDFKPATFPHHW